MFLWREQARRRLDAKRFPAPQFEPEVYPLPDSLQEGVKRQRAMFHFAMRQDPDFHVTLKFNDALDERQIWKRLRQFDAIVDHYWLGKRWASFPSEAHLSLPSPSVIVPELAHTSIFS